MSEAKVVYGWDGAAWRKLPLLWGYSDSWGQVEEGTASDTGHATTASIIVPAGYVYVLLAASVYHNAEADKRLVIIADVGGAIVRLKDEAAVAPDVHCCWGGNIVMKEGDYTFARAYSPGDGKRCFLKACGYKMKIAE